MKSQNVIFVLLVVVAAGATGIAIAQTINESPVPEPLGSPLTSKSDPATGDHPVLGKVLFEHVTLVHFCGTNMPANSDGSFGAWVGEEQGSAARMTIYENFIVKETVLPDGTTLRETRPYDQLGNIEQRIPANVIPNPRLQRSDIRPTY